MATNDGKATLVKLRVMLTEARQTDDAERIHVALIKVVDRLVNRVEEQEKAIAACQSKALSTQPASTVPLTF